MLLEERYLREVVIVLGALTRARPVRQALQIHGEDMVTGGRSEDLLYSECDQGYILLAIMFTRRRPKRWPELAKVDTAGKKR